MACPVSLSKVASELCLPNVKAMSRIPTAIVVGSSVIVGPSLSKRKTSAITVDHLLAHCCVARTGSSPSQAKTTADESPHALHTAARSADSCDIPERDCGGSYYSCSNYLLAILLDLQLQTRTWDVHNSSRRSSYKSQSSSSMPPEKDWTAGLLVPRVVWSALSLDSPESASERGPLMDQRSGQPRGGRRRSLSTRSLPARSLPSYQELPAKSWKDVEMLD